jgi:hypothetical protein
MIFLVAAKPNTNWTTKNTTINEPMIGSIGNNTGWIYARYKINGICGNKVTSRYVARDGTCTSEKEEGAVNHVC